MVVLKASNVSEKKFNVSSESKRQRNRVDNLKNKPLSKEEARKPFEKIAEGMETQFVHHMLKQMRQTIPQDKPDSSEVSYYNSLTDYERAKILATDPKGGIGIKKMVLDEILPHYLKKQPNHKPASQVHSSYMNAAKENSHE